MLHAVRRWRQQEVVSSELDRVAKHPHLLLAEFRRHHHRLVATLLLGIRQRPPPAVRDARLHASQRQSTLLQHLTSLTKKTAENEIVVVGALRVSKACSRSKAHFSSLSKMSVVMCLARTSSEDEARTRWHALLLSHAELCLTDSFEITPETL